MANANTNERIYENLIFDFSYNKKGEKIVSGAVNAYLNKIYGSEDVCQVKTVNVGGQDRVVASLTTGVKCDAFTAARLKYRFGKDIPVDSYINVRINAWDKVAERIAKLYLAEGNKILFFVHEFRLQDFARKDGTTGYQLEASAYNFTTLKLSTKEEGKGKQATWLNGAPAPAAAPAQPKAQANPLPDGFENSDFSDDGDLPF